MKSTGRLKIAHFRQLLSYIEECEREKWYYGNKKHFEKRHSDLKEWCRGAIKTLAKEPAPKQ